MSVTLIKAAWDHPPTVIGYKRLAVRRLKWVLSLGGPHWRPSPASTASRMRQQPSLS